MKCAVSDFDRTLYIGGSISPRNLKAIDKWQAAAAMIVEDVAEYLSMP
ncbi:hypothetical protein [Lacrimispora sp.]|nr:hypothetical protein [Lacrimispora sp.]